MDKEELKRRLELEQRREERFWQIVAYLNDIGDIQPHCFDCGGELGICVVEFRQQWYGCWYILEPDPIAKMEVERGSTG